MPPTTVAINGKTIESLGLRAVNLENWLRPVTPRFARTNLVGRVGSVPQVRGVEWEPVPLRLAVETPDDAAAITTARDVIANAYFELQGLLEIEIADAPDRVRYGVLEGASEGVTGIKLLSGMLRADVTITCFNPLWYDRYPRIVNGTTNTRIELPQGTAPGRFKILNVGGTNPTIRIRRHTGAVLQEMRFTVTLGATEALEIDETATWPVTKWTAGVASNAFSTLHAEDSILSSFDPIDGPLTIETTAGELIVTTWRGHLV